MKLSKKSTGKMTCECGAALPPEAMARHYHDLKRGCERCVAIESRLEEYTKGRVGRSERQTVEERALAQAVNRACDGFARECLESGRITLDEYWEIKGRRGRKVGAVRLPTLGFLVGGLLWVAALRWLLGWLGMEALLSLCWGLFLGGLGLWILLTVVLLLAGMSGAPLNGGKWEGREK